MNKLLSFGLVCGLALLTRSGVAEDIDLFLGIRDDVPLAANVLLVMDNAADFESSTGELADPTCPLGLVKVVDENNDRDGFGSCNNCTSTLLDAVSDFSAVAAPDGMFATLTWTDILGEEEYEIEYGAVGANGTVTSWNTGNSKTFNKNAGSESFLHAPGVGSWKWRIRGVKTSAQGGRKSSPWKESEQVLLTRAFTAGSGFNLHTTGSIAQCALLKAIESLPNDTVRIGIMVFNSSGVQTFANAGVGSNGTDCYDESGSGAREGGCLVYPMTLLDANSRQSLTDYIKSWVADGSRPPHPSVSEPKQIKGDRQRTAGAMQEAWAYLNAASDRVNKGLSGRLYDSSPIADGGCADQSYVIYVANAWANNAGPADPGNEAAGAAGALRQVVDDTAKHSRPRGLASGDSRYVEMTQEILGTRETFCKKSPTHTFSNQNHAQVGEYADEWSRYMFDKNDQFDGPSIATYTIGLTNRAVCKPDYPALLGSMAEQGGGQYYDVSNYDDFTEALNRVLSSILAVNSVFASVSLPISVNNQDTYLNQVYIGMFRPDAQTKPRWGGNLKQYQIDFVGETEELQLVDATGAAALASSGTGFLNPCAVSFWGPGTTDSYWPNTDAYANCGPGSGPSNRPDGNLVEKGGAGYQLRTAKADQRNLWTYCAACTDKVTPFMESTTLLSDSNLLTVCDNDALPECTPQDKADVLEWQQGYNNYADAENSFVDEFDSGARPNMRPTVHGDVVHSRPRAVNFGLRSGISGTAEVPRVVVFYGANDGSLRAINGNLTGQVGGKAPGGEIWSFIPPEFEDEFARMRVNYPLVKFLGKNEDFGRPKPYGFDGPVNAWIEQDGTEVTKAIVYATMRRGGRMVYAFDVTGLAPADGTYGVNPRLKWRFGCDDAGICTHENLDIGQTWSTPQVFKVQGDSATYLALGGGYDTCEDEDSLTNPCTGQPRGNWVYIINADTGALVRKFETLRSVVADLFVVPARTTSQDLGYASHLYASDLGGNLYRITGSGRQELNNEPSNWEMVRIASFGCDDSPSTGCNRKFFYAPDVTATADGYALLIGSGDREKPLPDFDKAAAVQNYFYMIKDNLTESAWLCPDQQPGTACEGGYIQIGDLARIDPQAQLPPVGLGNAQNRGWYLPLNQKEQVVTSALTVFGVTVFSTHTPVFNTEEETGTCAPNLGTARAYQVLTENGVGAIVGSNGNVRSQSIAGGGLPPSPVAGQVEIDGKVVAFIIGASSNSALEARAPNLAALPSQPKGRRYWYVEQ